MAEQRQQQALTPKLRYPFLLVTLHIVQRKTNGVGANGVGRNSLTCNFPHTKDAHMKTNVIYTHLPRENNTNKLRRSRAAIC